MEGKVRALDHMKSYRESVFRTNRDSSVKRTVVHWSVHQSLDLCSMLNGLSCFQKRVERKQSKFLQIAFSHETLNSNTLNLPSRDHTEVTKELGNSSIPLTLCCNWKIVILFSRNGFWMTFYRLSLDEFGILKLIP